MMQARFIYILFFFACLNIGLCECLCAQESKTLHFIYFADTNDSEVGKSSEEANRYFINNFIPMVRQNTSLKIKSYCFYGQDFSKQKLNNVINNLQTGTDDAIFFYYTGHGFNENYNDFPTLTLGLRGDALSARKKSLLDIYNTLKSKPHRLLIVMAEACNAIYGSRINSGNYTGSNYAFEGNNQNLRKLFVDSSGNYLMSSSKKGQKSYCPSGGLGYFTRAFRDALYERTSTFTVSSFLDKVAKKTTIYADKYAAETQHPHWLSEDYADGKSKKIGSGSVLSKRTPNGQIKNISVVTDTDDLRVKVSFSISGMKGKKGLVACYFYNNARTKLKDQNSSHATSDGQIATHIDITPGYDNTLYTDLEIVLPKSELHQSGTYTRPLAVQVIVWDMSSTRAVELLRSNMVSFDFTPTISFLKVDGYTSNRSVDFDEDGGVRTFAIDTSSDNYELCYLPSWFSITNKTSASFTLSCEANSSRRSRSDYMKVIAAGKEIRIDISQLGKSGPSANIENVWVDHNVMNGMFKGMNIHVKFSVDGMNHRRCNVVAAFYYADNVTPLRNQYGGNLAYNCYGNVTYDSARWDNFTLFVPYGGLFIIGSGIGYYSFDILIQDDYGNILDRLNNIQFTYYQ